MTEEKVIKTIDLDEEIISHCFIPESVQFLRDEALNTRLIFDSFARDVYSFQMEHVQKFKVPATPEVLLDQFDGFNETPILEYFEPVTAVGDLLERLRQRYIRYDGKKTIDSLADQVIDDPLAVANRMLVEGRRLAELTISRGDVYGTGDFDKAWNHYQAKKELGDKPSIGYELIDEHFTGLLGLTFMMASKKSYKSWLTINSMLTNVMLGRKCTLYSLELPAAEAYWRAACMAAGVPYWRYHKDSLEMYKSKIETVAEELDLRGMFQIEKPPVGARGVQHVIEHALNQGSEVVYIDQLQYLENRTGTSVGAANNTGVYWEVCNDLRDYSDDVPIWVVHQLNRGAMATNEFPTSEHGKGSAAIEETATLELGLWANKEMRASNRLQIGTMESRNHEHKHWYLDVRLSDDCAFEMIGEVTDEIE